MANRTIIRIMQLKRRYFRRVKVLRSYIYEQGLNARRAYCSIRLAVKTSRPHFNKKIEIAKLRFLNHQLKLISKKINSILTPQSVA